MKCIDRILYIRKRGSFTVEAALIMPMILGVIVLFIYIAMFAHDRCVLEYACQTASARAAYDRSDPEEEAERIMELNTRSSLILNWDMDMHASADETVVTAYIEATPPVLNITYTHSASAYGYFCPKY